MSAIGLLPDGMTLCLGRTWDPGGSFTNDPLSCFDKNNSCDGSVMKRSLPPLNGLRAFEAAARHMSFTDAADELSVTQAAISHQVRGLEQRLGLKLFVRRNRSLLLSEAGQAYLPSVSGALDQGGVRDEVAAAAARRLPARQSRDRCADQHRHGADRFLARGCRYRHPL